MGNPCTNDPNQMQSSSLTIAGGSFSQYDKNGITCDGVLTTCTIANSQVTGVGATAQLAENGIQIAYGASATISQVTVNDNQDSNGGVAASGILAYADAGVTVAAGTVTANDIDVAPELDSGFTITGTHITSATDVGVGDGQGILADASTLATIGGSSAADADTITLNPGGGVIDDASTSTAIEHDTITHNAAGGVVGDGATGEQVGAAGAGNSIANNVAGNVIEWQMTSCSITDNTFAGSGGGIWETPDPDCSSPSGNTGNTGNTPTSGGALPPTNPVSPSL